MARKTGRLDFLRIRIWDMAGCNLEILQVEKMRSGRTRHSEHRNQQIIDSLDTEIFFGYAM
jgi:hypothetical protein